MFISRHAVEVNLSCVTEPVGSVVDSVRSFICCRPGRRSSCPRWGLSVLASPPAQPLMAQ